jgi:hypothetical protein
MMQHCLKCYVLKGSVEHDSQKYLENWRLILGLGLKKRFCLFLLMK